MYKKKCLRFIIVAIALNSNTNGFIKLYSFICIMLMLYERGKNVLSINDRA